MKVIVVGAGILGASAAYHLAREGCEVTLIDRADEGRATAAGAGIVCPWGSPGEDAASYGLLAGGAKYYPEWAASTYRPTRMNSMPWSAASDPAPLIGQWVTSSGLHHRTHARCSRHCAPTSPHSSCQAAPASTAVVSLPRCTALRSSMARDS